MTKIIITGGTGFVGKNLIPVLASHFNPKNILCLVWNHESQFELNGRNILKKAGVLQKKVDLATGFGLNNINFIPDIVIHLAAQTDTSVNKHFVNNIGTKNLYNCLNLNKKTHFIHISTMVLTVGRHNCSTPIDESTPNYPTNEYTRTKLDGENFIYEKALEKGFKLTILRPNTIYGKNVRHNSLFDMVLNLIKSNSLITRINWPGKSALIHVDDVVKAIFYFANNPPKENPPGKYLLYAENLSINDISKLIMKKLGLKQKTIHVPKLFWQILKIVRVIIPFFEHLLPSYIYNYLWRFSVIIDNSVWAKSDKINKIIPNWKPKLLENNLSDIL